MKASKMAAQKGDQRAALTAATTEVLKAVPKVDSTAERTAIH